MIRIYEIQTANYKRDPDWEKAREKALTNCNQQSYHKETKPLHGR